MGFFKSLFGGAPKPTLPPVVAPPPPPPQLEQAAQTPQEAQTAVTKAKTDAEEKARLRAQAAQQVFTSSQGDLTQPNLGKVQLGA